ncbi:hypothetical protein HUJ04_000315 [Dendroctonus ponderosae]|nr:hypothetical protein HUJ04_000315 [Dendroctonus ponderosae]
MWTFPQLLPARLLGASQVGPWWNREMQQKPADNWVQKFRKPAILNAVGLGRSTHQKHPHVIFEARTKANKGCATTGTMEWRLNLQGAKVRTRRDIREVTKYIETALIIDKAMFEKRNGSTRIEVVHDSIQVANIADLYFRTLNTRVSVVYIESWQVNRGTSADCPCPGVGARAYRLRPICNVVRNLN